jgi:hypothetical protein
VNLALISGSSFEQFHFDVLQFFVPGRLFESLKQNLFRRLQHSDESFPAYVSSIRDAALVLELPVSEQEIINNILDGLSPAQRSRFVFQARPSTWADVDSLCVHDRNVFFADSNRQHEGPAPLHLLHACQTRIRGVRPPDLKC